MMWRSVVRRASLVVKLLTSESSTTIRSTRSMVSADIRTLGKNGRGSIRDPGEQRGVDALANQVTAVAVAADTGQRILSVLGPELRAENLVGRRSPPQGGRPLRRIELQRRPVARDFNRDPRASGRGSDDLRSDIEPDDVGGVCEIEQ